MKKTLFLQTSALALLVAAGGMASSSAQAQGFFGSVEGRYLVTGKSGLGPVTDDGNGNALPSLGGENDFKNGWGGRVFLGYRFANNWDIGLGAAGAFLGTGKDSRTTSDLLNPESQETKIKGRQWLIDLEAGYNVGLPEMGANLRLFGGARYARITQSLKGNYNSFLALVGPLTQEINYDVSSRYWGIGPRLGMQVDVPLGKQSNFGVSFAVAGSVLFGHMNSSVSGSNFTQLGAFPPSTVPITGSDKGSQRVLNVEGEIGLWYALSQTFKVTAGYRAEGWFNAIGKAGNSGSNDRILSGPFVRASFNFGAPAPAPMASAPPPVNPPRTANTYTVFFDFDRSNITAQAQTTIDQAVAAAKAGNSARVTLTGHTDRSGSEQYNLALSLRRGEAVKAAMIRGGIPASAIVVIGRGESVPLVNTPDGVREPQNRRVEIVL